MGLRLYEYTSYKEFLADYIEANRRPGIVTELAQAARCDRTYLSQVLSRKAQLTPDHALGIAEYLNFSEPDQEFFLLLVLYERAANPRAREILNAKIQRRAQDNLILTKKIMSQATASEISEEQKTFYYSSWKPASVHLLTSAEKFRSVDAIAQRLSLPRRQIEDILGELARMGLVAQKGAEFHHSGANIHVPRGSPHNLMNHLHWRNRAVDASGGDGVHYTSIFAVSRADWPGLKARILEFIESQRKMIAESGAEDVYAFTCDLFRPN